MLGADGFQLIVSTDLFACKPSRSGDKAFCGHIKQNSHQLDASQVSEQLDLLSPPLVLILLGSTCH